MPGTKELQRRIKSIGSTKKITRAMQMVSAAKMRKSQSANAASRSYSALAWELIGRLPVIPAQAGIKNIDSGSEAGMTRLLQSFPNAKKVGIILITSNRGLVGGFNANLITKLLQLEKDQPILHYELFTVGKKGRDASLRLKQNITAEFTKQDTTIPIEQIYPLSQMVTELYESGEYSNIYIIYNHFISTLVQTATVKQLLPFVNLQYSSPQSMGRVPKGGERLEPISSSSQTDYLFEPSPQAVLKHLLPRIVESQIYQSILENDASEHSARMIMMKNATDAAGDLIDDFTLTYNQLRQSKITTELSEITAGKIALENQ